MGKIIDVEYKEILPDGSIYSELYEVNKYACDLLNKFNSKHNTNFSCNFGLKDGYIMQSSMNKYGQITIAVAHDLMPDGHNKDRVESMKLLVTHELASHLYKGLTVSSIDKLAAVADKLVNTYRRLIMTASIKVACDLHAKRLYESMGNTITDNIYTEYVQMLKEGKRESERNIPYFLNKGTLPPSYRLKYMRNYKSFKSNDYQIVTSIILDLSKLSVKYLDKRLGLMTYEKWIKAQMDIDNFPNRINKIRQ